ARSWTPAVLGRNLEFLCCSRCPGWANSTEICARRTSDHRRGRNSESQGEAGRRFRRAQNGPRRAACFTATPMRRLQPSSISVLKAVASPLVRTGRRTAPSFPASSVMATLLCDSRRNLFSGHVFTWLGGVHSMSMLTLSTGAESTQLPFTPVTPLQVTCTHSGDLVYCGAEGYRQACISQAASNVFKKFTWMKAVRLIRTPSADGAVAAGPHTARDFTGTPVMLFDHWS
ncbi:unnamed protein product, partial [Symbiodinium necroappetens]